MKTRIFLCLALLLILFPLQSISASPALPTDTHYLGRGVWLVIPHNSSPDDPNRLQAVIDLAKPGDTVQLAAGTFNFSEFEYVRIAKNLTLKGAWDSRRLIPLTKIKNGFNPILIGRKTPVEKPAEIEINGHTVTHITQDTWGKFIFPSDYLPLGTYNVFDDWVPVSVNIAQITFIRPYNTAISSSGMNGGTIEKIRVESAWPSSGDNTNVGANATGISWYNFGALYIVTASYRGVYDPGLYTGTDLVSGNLVIQDSVFQGDHKTFSLGDVDEAGDSVSVLFDPASSTPPNGKYEKYVLQDVAFEWDAQTRPIPDSIQRYWVKKGYTAYFDGESIRALRGLSDGFYSLYSQSNLTVRRNVFQNCGESGFFVMNGFKDVPFNALIEKNKIIASPDSTWVSGFFTVGFPITNPETGETWLPGAGENIVFRDNEIKVSNPNQVYWESVVNISSYAKALITNNHINLTSGSGIKVSWPAQTVTVSGNTISGTGDYAFFADWEAGGNKYLFNNLRGFTPNGPGMFDVGVPAAHGLLLSDDNTVIARPGENNEVVWDLGSNNTVIGMVHKTLTLTGTQEMLRETAPHQRNNMRVVR